MLKSVNDYLPDLIAQFPTVPQKILNEQLNMDGECYIITILEDVILLLVVLSTDTGSTADNLHVILLSITTTIEEC